MNLENMDQLIDGLAERLKVLKESRDRFKDELEGAKAQLKDKEMEHIRQDKESQRRIEQLAREKMNLQQEKAQLESRLTAVYGKLKNLLPQEGPDNRG
jgi:chromosome segregation ATPase